MGKWTDRRQRSTRSQKYMTCAISWALGDTWIKIALLCSPCKTFFCSQHFWVACRSSSRLRPCELSLLHVSKSVCFALLREEHSWLSNTSWPALKTVVFVYLGIHACIHTCMLVATSKDKRSQSFESEWRGRMGRTGGKKGGNGNYYLFLFICYIDMCRYVLNAIKIIGQAQWPHL